MQMTLKATHFVREDPLNLSLPLPLNLGVDFSTPVALFFVPPTIFRFQDLYICRD